MNRTILFRGKRVDNGEWIEGDLIHRKIWGKEIAVIRVSDDGFDNYDEYEVIPETIGQYTGLTDKNGKKIFEGDVIRYADLYDYNCYIESLDNTEAYDNIDFGYIWTIGEVVYGINIGYPAFDLNKHDFESNALSELSESGDFYYEVIGNVYDGGVKFG